jgi:hypothetical protein
MKRPLGPPMTLGNKFKTFQKHGPRGAEFMIDWKRLKELLGERKVVVALVLVAIVAIWMFRFETFGYQGLMHRNRITGAICAIDRECWWPRGRFN